MMKEMTRKALGLGLIGAVAAILLATANSLTEPVINEIKAEKLASALTEMASGGTPGDVEEHPENGIARRWPIEGTGGWILELEASGYGGPMTVIASFSREGDLMVAKLMDNDETVGFGKKAEEPGYMDIFAGKGGTVPMPVTKAQLGDDVDTVSGATVTFTGVSAALKTGSDAVKRWGEKE